MISLKVVTCSNESQKVRDHGAMRSQQGRKPLQRAGEGRTRQSQQLVLAMRLRKHPHMKCGTHPCIGQKKPLQRAGGRMTHQSQQSYFSMRPTFDKNTRNIVERYGQNVVHEGGNEYIPKNPSPLTVFIKQSPELLQTRPFPELKSRNIII